MLMSVVMVTLSLPVVGMTVVKLIRLEGGYRPASSRLSLSLTMCTYPITNTTRQGSLSSRSSSLRIQYSKRDKRGDGAFVETVQLQTC